MNTAGKNGLKDGVDRDEKEGTCQESTFSAEVVLNPLEISDPRIVYLIEYIANHPWESLTLKLMSGRICCTPEHLSRLMKQLVGEGFQNLKREYRMTLAGLLLEAGWAIKQVASLCGWISVEGFTRGFKKCFDTTPGAFQKRSKGLRGLQYTNDHVYPPSLHLANGKIEVKIISNLVKSKSLTVRPV
jgi:AraC-like DNA-binding protein